MKKQSLSLGANMLQTAKLGLILAFLIAGSKFVIANVVIQNAANPAFNYYGRWQLGSTAVTINSGALVEFAYSGGACTLLFDVKDFTQFPAIFVQVDNNAVTRTTLATNLSSVSIPSSYAIPAGSPPFQKVSSRYHLIRFWVATHSLFRTSVTGKQWENLDGACRFLGIKFEDGEIISLPYVEHQIEFLGDSITQGLRLLYTGSDDDTGHQLPYANWPQLTADLLCMKPVVTGFGGQGLSKSGTCGAPAANTAFPFIYQGAAWVPKVKPDAVVIYQGTNDRIPPDEFQNAYHAFLQSVRRTYPSSLIFAICPRGKPYAKAIQSAVQQMNDATISFLDYSSGLISKYETSDGCHLNPGGAIRFAIRLSHDIQDHLGRAK